MSRPICKLCGQERPETMMDVAVSMGFDRDKHCHIQANCDGRVVPKTKTCNMLCEYCGLGRRWVRGAPAPKGGGK